MNESHSPHSLSHQGGSENKGQKRKKEYFEEDHPHSQRDASEGRDNEHGVRSEQGERRLRAPGITMQDLELKNRVRELEERNRHLEERNRHLENQLALHVQGCGESGKCCHTCGRSYPVSPTTTISTIEDVRRSSNEHDHGDHRTESSESNEERRNGVDKPYGTSVSPPCESSPHRQPHPRPQDATSESSGFSSSTEGISDRSSGPSVPPQGITNSQTLANTSCRTLQRDQGSVAGPSGAHVPVASSTTAFGPPEEGPLPGQAGQPLPHHGGPQQGSVPSAAAVTSGAAPENEAALSLMRLLGEMKEPQSSTTSSCGSGGGGGSSGERREGGDGGGGAARIQPQANPEQTLDAVGSAGVATRQTVPRVNVDAPLLSGSSTTHCPPPPPPPPPPPSAAAASAAVGGGVGGGGGGGQGGGGLSAGAQLSVVASSCGQSHHVGSCCGDMLTDGSSTTAYSSDAAEAKQLVHDITSTVIPRVSREFNSKCSRLLAILHTNPLNVVNVPGGVPQVEIVSDGIKHARQQVGGPNSPVPVNFLFVASSETAKQLVVCEFVGNKDEMARVFSSKTSIKFGGKKSGSTFMFGGRSVDVRHGSWQSSLFQTRFKCRKYAFTSCTPSSSSSSSSSHPSPVWAQSPPAYRSDSFDEASTRAKEADLIAMFASGRAV